MKLTDYKLFDKTVGIVALSNTKEFIPWELNIDWWTMNNGIRLYRDKNIKLFSDLHKWHNAEYDAPYYSDLINVKLKAPLLIPEFDSNIVSNQIEYPYSEITREFGFGIKNTVPALILLALYFGYENILLFGLSKEGFCKYPEMGFSLYQAIGFVRGKGKRTFIVNSHEMDDGISYGQQDLLLRNIKG